MKPAVPRTHGPEAGVRAAREGHTVTESAMNELLVFLDVDTQVDFMLPTGSLYVPGTDAVKAITEEGGRKAIMEMTAAGVRLVSTTEVCALIAKRR
jgi:hypothetical protein